MKVMGISAASRGRIAGVFKDVWVTYLENGYAPSPWQVRAICEVNGVDFKEVYRLLVAFDGWSKRWNEK